MGAWVEISERDVLTAVSEEELTRWREAARVEVPGLEDDPLPLQVRQVAAMVRGYVFACRSNARHAKARGGAHTLGAYTVPESLVRTALAILVPIITGRVGGLMLDAQGLRNSADEAAMRTLQAVAKCEFQVDPDWPIEIAGQKRLDGEKVRPVMCEGKRRAL